jgi:hypothetical protein
MANTMKTATTRKAGVSTGILADSSRPKFQILCFDGAGEVYNFQDKADALAKQSELRSAGRRATFWACSSMCVSGGVL